MNEDAYLWEKVSSKTKSRLVFWLVRSVIKSSSLPLVVSANRFLSRRIDYHLFTFVNGASFSRKFKKCGNFPRIGEGCIILYPEKIEVGSYVSIGNYVTVYNESNGKKIKIGNNTHILDFTLISGVGGVEIGDNIAISSGVKIYSHSNDYKDKDKLIVEQVKKGKISIGNNVLIGANVVILPGIKIGDNTVVGAGAVVTKDIPKNSVAVGTPARVIKKTNF